MAACRSGIAGYDKIEALNGIAYAYVTVIKSGSIKDYLKCIDD